MSRNLLETISAVGSKVDTQTGTIYGVRLLNPRSANGRFYPPRIVKKLIPLLEGKWSYLDHPPKAGMPRSSKDKIGQFVNVRSSPDGGIQGDFRVLRGHPYAQSILEAASQNPEAYSFSINAKGDTVRSSDGTEIVESIHKVFSVDLVDQGATTKSLFEGLQPMKFKDLLESLAVHPGLPKKVRKLLLEAEEMMPDDAMGADMPADMPPPDAEGGDPMEALASGFRAAVIAYLDDESMDLKTKLAKIGELLKTQDKLISGGSSGGSAETPADSEPMTEACDESKMEEEKEKEMKESRELLSLAGVPESEDLLESVCCMPRDARVKHIKWLKENLKTIATAEARKPAAKAPAIRPTGKIAENSRWQKPEDLLNSLKGSRN